MYGCDMVWPRPIGIGMSAYAMEQDRSGMNRWRFVCPMAPKDPLRQALLSQGTGVGPGVGPDGFDHGGAFADTLVLCGSFPRGGNHGKHEQQQGLHGRAVSNRSTRWTDLAPNAHGHRLAVPPDV